MATTECWASDAVRDTIRDYAILQGLIKRQSSDDSSVTNISVSLTPHTFPTELFQLACSVQADLNLVMDKVSRDHQFLTTVLESAAKSDDFTRRLIDIYKLVANDNKQVCTLNIQRADYMLDLKPGASPQLKQVEVNTMSVSCLGHTQGNIERLHRFVKKRFNLPGDDYSIPNNTCLDSLVEGIAQAWKLYSNQKAYVMIVGDPAETNFYDQRPIEFNLWEKWGIPLIFKSLEDIWKEGRLGEHRELLINGVEVAVTYYRTGYAPEQYESDKEWEARRLCELSLSCCVPTIAYQLAGSKKIQQALAQTGALERYLPDSEAVAALRTTFAGLYSLEPGPEAERVVEMAMKNPNDFVAKPEREGGGNNLFGDDVRTLLEDPHKRSLYILMDLIRPPSQPSVVLAKGGEEIHTRACTCELGVLGVLLRRGDEIIMNVEGGHILRTKPHDAREGGLIKGSGALDLPTLVPLAQYREVGTQDNETN